jgi:hypothetical protein
MPTWRFFRIVSAISLALDLAMNWYYALGGEQTGPVSETQLDELVQSGKISRDTPVWHEGMADWQPWHTVRAAGPPPLPGMPSGVVCVECGRTFPPAEVIKLNQSWVCAQCKPIFLQRLSEGAAPSGVGIWRQGRQLITRSETPFPDRCVKCNAPANGFRLKRILYWQHPAYYLLLLCNLLILIIVVLIVRKKAVLHVGLCEKHRAQRKMGLTLGWTGALGGIALLIGAAAFQSGWTALAGVAAFLFGCIYGGVRASTITATKITKENVWVRGVHRDFLNQLPEWPGS